MYGCVKKINWNICMIDFVKFLLKLILWCMFYVEINFIYIGYFKYWNWWLGSEILKLVGLFISENKW